jgi:hypothetical protein
VETAVGIAFILAAGALFIMATLAAILLAYLIFIVKNVLDVTRRVKQGTIELGEDVRKALSEAVRAAPKLLGFASRRKKAERD